MGVKTNTRSLYVVNACEIIFNEPKMKAYVVLNKISL